MAQRKFEIDELVIRPGTYFNPQTEVMIVVDDSPSMDGEIFNMEDFEGADWVLVSDELPIDEPQRDELLEGFQARYHGGDGRGERSLEEEDELEREGVLPGEAEEDEEPETFDPED